MGDMCDKEDEMFKGRDSLGPVEVELPFTSSGETASSFWKARCFPL
jgi:hypothetical protein